MRFYGAAGKYDKPKEGFRSKSPWPSVQRIAFVGAFRLPEAETHLGKIALGEAPRINRRASRRVRP